MASVRESPASMVILKFFYDRYDVNEVLKENHLTAEQIAEDVKKV